MSVEISAIGSFPVTGCWQEFSELKILYDTVQATDFADLEYKASAKSHYWAHMCEQ